MHVVHRLAFIVVALTAQVLWTESLGQHHRHSHPHISPSTQEVVIGRFSSAINMEKSSSVELVSPLESSGRKLPSTPTPVFIGTLLFLPVWATTILPLSVTYQLARAAIRTVTSSSSSSSKKDDTSGMLNLDSGYIVDESRRTPRAERKYDIVVLGATGFTGRLAVRYLIKAHGVDKQVKWAIAGRSQAKLQQIKEELAKELNMETVLQLDTIIVDTSIPSTMPQLVDQTRVVATTAGPYAQYGSPVVEFCAKFGTHYVDITGEVTWVKNMIAMWQETAQTTGARLIPFCGHDCIPWDLSTMKLQELLQEKCQDVLQSVTFWDEMKGMAGGGTMATVMSAIEGKAMNAPAGPIDQFRRLSDGSKSQYSVIPNLPSFIARSTSPFDRIRSRWTMPFVMAAVNSRVIGWSHALRCQGSSSLVYREMAQCADFKTAFSTYFQMAMLGSMLFNPLTASLLQKYVLPAPGTGPSMESMERKHFLCIKGEGVGANGNRVESIMYFDKDAGCLETSRMLIESGLCLALEEGKLPNQGKGGFWTASTGLGDLLLDRLIKSGTYFATRVVPSVQSKL